MEGESVLNFLVTIDKYLVNWNGTTSLISMEEACHRKWKKRSMEYGIRLNRPLPTWANIFVHFVSSDEKEKYRGKRGVNCRNYIKSHQEDGATEISNGGPYPSTASSHRSAQERRPRRVNDENIPYRPCLHHSCVACLFFFPSKNKVTRHEIMFPLWR